MIHINTPDLLFPSLNMYRKFIIKTTKNFRIKCCLYHCVCFPSTGLDSNFDSLHLYPRCLKQLDPTQTFLYARTIFSTRCPRKTLLSEMRVEGTFIGHLVYTDLSNFFFSANSILELIVLRVKFVSDFSKVTKLASGRQSLVCSHYSDILQGRKVIFYQCERYSFSHENIISILYQ